MNITQCYIWFPDDSIPSALALWRFVSSRLLVVTSSPQPSRYFAGVQKTKAIKGKEAWLCSAAELAISVGGTDLNQVAVMVFLDPRLYGCAEIFIFYTSSFLDIDESRPNLLQSQDFIWPVRLKIFVTKRGKKSVLSIRLQCSLVDNCINSGFCSHNCNRRQSPAAKWRHFQSCKYTDDSNLSP